MDFKIPQEAIDTIAQHINERNNKSYSIPTVGVDSNIETPQIFEIVSFEDIDKSDIRAFAVDGSKNSHSFYNGVTICLYRAGYVCFEHGMFSKSGLMAQMILLFSVSLTRQSIF